MKILHFADLHLDSAYRYLSDQLAKERRFERINLLSNIIDIANDNEVEVILFAGDLFDIKNTTRSTVERAFDLFKKAQAKIHISPGNHDYYSDQSPYTVAEIPINVHIFKREKIERVDVSEAVSVYGGGFNSSWVDRSMLSGFSVEDESKMNLMVLHGDVGGNSRWNPMTEAEIATSGLDYLALGHIHLGTNVKKVGRTTYAYSGVPEGRGFDECGNRGVYLLDVTKEKITSKFIETYKYIYLEIPVDLTDCADIYSKIEANMPENRGNCIVRLILQGEYDNLDKIAISNKFSSGFYGFELIDETTPTRNLWEISDKDSLKGVFISNMKMLYDSSEDKTSVADALKIGIAALENREI